MLKTIWHYVKVVLKALLSILKVITSAPVKCIIYTLNGDFESAFKEIFYGYLQENKKLKEFKKGNGEYTYKRFFLCGDKRTNEC